MGRKDRKAGVGCAHSRFSGLEPITGQSGLLLRANALIGGILASSSPALTYDSSLRLFSINERRPKESHLDRSSCVRSGPSSCCSLDCKGLREYSQFPFI